MTYIPPREMKEKRRAAEDAFRTSMTPLNLCIMALENAWMNEHTEEEWEIIDSLRSEYYRIIRQGKSERAAWVRRVHAFLNRNNRGQGPREE
jgi:hypothetical protein